MPEVVLAGCHPEPLASYLKALGVLRVVAEQKDPEAFGWWRDEQFVLASELSEDDLVRFFAEEYRPTPIVAPWNKDSGFYRTHREALTALEDSLDERLHALRDAIRIARWISQGILQRMGLSEPPDSGQQARRKQFLALLMPELRARLPEAAVRWLDAAMLVVAEQPISGGMFRGGADGRNEIAGVYAECLARAFGLLGGAGRSGARRSSGVRAALFGAEEKNATVQGITGGLLFPASTEAPNAVQGFKSQTRINPWDQVLALEGALLLAGSVSRRLGVVARQGAAFPFTVAAASAAHPTAGLEESRGEVWLPLWSRGMTLEELKYLFREGRAEWAGRSATTAADMARAVVGLGVERGLDEFVRFGVQKRSGDSHLAVALGRFRVVERSGAGLLGELDGLLSQLRGVASGERQRRRKAPSSGALAAAYSRLEDAILSYSAHGGRERLLRVLGAAWVAERTVARMAARPGRGGRQQLPGPLRGLSGQWAQACDDGSVEFELAAAVASLRGAERGPGPFRRHLEPVRRGADGSWAWAEEASHEVVWTGRDPVADLAAVLERRILDAERAGVDPPLDGFLRAHPAAVVPLLEGELDLDRLARLSEALALVDWERVDWSGDPVRLATRPHPPAAALPATYAVLKLAFLGRPIRLGELEVSVGPDATILGLLRAGDVWAATVRAARRLRAVGLTVKGVPRDERRAPIVPDHEAGRRLLAALVVPVHEGPLVRAVLEEGEEAEEGGSS